MTFWVFFITLLGSIIPFFYFQSICAGHHLMHRVSQNIVKERHLTQTAQGTDLTVP